MTTVRASGRNAASISPRQLAHMVVQASDMDKSRKWYEQVLGARTIFHSDFACFLTYDSEHHRVALLNTKGADRERHSVIDHLAFTYDNLGDLLSTYFRLKKIGILPVRTINHGPTISFYYRDPDGVKIELQVDNFATSEEATAFFHSDEFRANPVGVFVTPETLLEEWEAGKPWEEIRKRPPLPAGMTPLDMRKEREWR